MHASTGAWPRWRCSISQALRRLHLWYRRPRRRCARPPAPSMRLHHPPPSTRGLPSPSTDWARRTGASWRASCRSATAAPCPSTTPTRLSSACWEATTMCSLSSTPRSTRETAAAAAAALAPAQPSPTACCRPRRYSPRLPSRHRSAQWCGRFLPWSTAAAASRHTPVCTSGTFSAACALSASRLLPARRLKSAGASCALWPCPRFPARTLSSAPSPALTACALRWRASATSSDHHSQRPPDRPRRSY